MNIRISREAKRVLGNKAQEVTDKILATYHSSFKASGRFGDALEFRIEETEGGLRAGIYALDYVDSLQDGSPPTNFTYEQALEWIDNKGIFVNNEKQFASNVSKQVMEQGYRVPSEHNPRPILESAIKSLDDFRFVNDFIEKTAQIIADDFFTRP